MGKRVSKVSVKERERVYEHRITSRMNGYNIRYWIESDPAFGGVVTFGEARKAVFEAEKTAEIYAIGPQQIVDALMHVCPCANSIEACDDFGDGGALHRDWP